MEIRTHNSTPPAELLRALDLKNASLHYTHAQAVYQCIWLCRDSCCGVFGDGNNAAYEWFVWRDDATLETSDACYGSIAVALRDALLQTEGYPDPVRHALS